MTFLPPWPGPCRGVAQYPMGKGGQVSDGKWRPAPHEEGHSGGVPYPPTSLNCPVKNAW